jgi:acetyltransferase-like isoleucine patch superfamily enzyme
MAGKMLSVEPTVDPSAKLHDTRLGAYCEVGARTILHEVVMDDYSYVVNDAQITYTTIGKFCSIAAMTRINPGNHPMHRASQAHFTYRASAYFPGETTRLNSSNGAAAIGSISATTSGSGMAPTCCRAAVSAPAPWSPPARS